MLIPNIDILALFFNNLFYNKLGRINWKIKAIISRNYGDSFYIRYPINKSILGTAPETLRALNLIDPSKDSVIVIFENGIVLLIDGAWLYKLNLAKKFNLQQWPVEIGTISDPISSFTSQMSIPQYSIFSKMSGLSLLHDGRRRYTEVNPDTYTNMKYDSFFLRFNRCQKWLPFLIQKDNLQLINKILKETDPSRATVSEGTVSLIEAMRLGTYSMAAVLATVLQEVQIDINTAIAENWYMKTPRYQNASQVEFTTNLIKNIITPQLTEGRSN